MALAGGVTTAVTCPGDANLIGGTCAAIKTSGKTVSEMTMVPELAFHMCLTDDVRTTYSSKRAPKTRLASAALIREALMKAKNYHTLWKLSEADPSRKPPKFDMKLHSLMRVFDGMPVKITAKRSHDMTTAINRDGVTVLLVEQNAKKALSIANQAYVLETGKIVLSGDAKQLMNDDKVKKAYLSE